MFGTPLRRPVCAEAHRKLAKHSCSNTFYGITVHTRTVSACAHHHKGTHLPYSCVMGPRPCRLTRFALSHTMRSPLMFVSPLRPVRLFSLVWAMFR